MASFAQGTGSESDPYVITDTQVAHGPKNAARWGDYTYYQYVATKDGVLTVVHTLSGSVNGQIVCNGVTHNIISAITVAKDDVVIIKLFCEVNNTENTVGVKVRDYAEGDSRETSIPLLEGENSLVNVNNGDLPKWYSINVPAGKYVSVAYGNYPVVSHSGITGISNKDNEVIYINYDEQDVTFYATVTYCNSATATVTYGNATDVKPDVTRIGALNYSVTAEGVLTITFPEIEGAVPGDDITVSAYVFGASGGQPNGQAPVNLSNFTYTGTVADGVVIDNLTLKKRSSYILKVNEVGVRKYGETSYGRPQYSYSIPNESENDELSFLFVGGVASQKITTGIDDVIIDVDDAQQGANDCSTVLYNLNGQRVSSLNKGIVVRNGKKILVK